MKFMKKNYIIGIAITLAILMCMPVLTINAIDSMSGGKSVNGARTAAPTTSDIQPWNGIDHATKALILKDAAGYPTHLVGNNPNIYYNSQGYIVLCGVGQYSGKSYTTTLERAWYL